MTMNVDQTVVLDLTRIGAFLDVATPVDQVSVIAHDHETWGAGVVSVSKLLGGDGVAFTPAVVVSNAAPTAELVPVEDAPGVRLTVTTVGTGFGRVGVYGKNLAAGGA